MGQEAGEVTPPIRNLTPPQAASLPCEGRVGLAIILPRYPFHECDFGVGEAVEFVHEGVNLAV